MYFTLFSNRAYTPDGPQDDKARKLDKPIPRSIREKALFVRSGDGAWEFLRAMDSNWDRDKLEYREPAAAAH